MAMHDLWNRLTDDINWDSVSDKGRKLSETTRRNLIMVSAICAMGGSLSAGVALVGNYAPRNSYCNPQTNPCTQIEIDANADRPLNIDVKYLPGFGLQRTAASVLATILFGTGLLAIAKAEEEQEEIEPKLQLKQQIKIKRLELEANTELVNLENLAQTRVEVHEQELKESVAEMFFERNPEAIAQYLPKTEPKPSELEPQSSELEAKLSPGGDSTRMEPKPEVEPEPELFFGVELPNPPLLDVEFWNWQWFNNRADEMPHIRIIAPTGGGKTTLCDWLVDVVPADERKVITVKRKPHQWVGLPVYGVPFEYHVVRQQLERLVDEMVERTRLMEKGEYRGKLSAIVDEWKAIARNVKSLKDEETKVIISPSAKEMMGDLLTLSRESLIRIFALAQGRQVITWGLEGESDILECFTTIYIGLFALEEAEAKQRKYAKDSEEFEAWGKVIEFLRSLGKRAAWVECEFGKFPAIVPDLSKWKREIHPRGEKVIEPVTRDKNLTLPLPETQAEQAFGALRFQIGEPETAPQSHDSDISPDELLRQNLDRILAGFEQNLIQSVNLEDSDLDGSHSELQEPKNHKNEPIEPLQDIAIKENLVQVPAKLYTPLNLTFSQVKDLIRQLRTELNQTQTIERIWQVRKGGSKAWKKARDEFRELQE